MSTHFPPSQPDGAPHDSSETAPQVPYESTRAAGPHPTNPPLSRSQRRGWNTATGIIGGLGALSLLAVGAGAATAAVMTQERTDTWIASSDASRIVVDSNSANVRVHTSPTVENVEVKWQEFGWGLGDQPAPQETDGVIRLTAPEQTSRWKSAINNIDITVPESNSDTSLDLDAEYGLVHVTGAFDEITATSTFGSVSADSVKASVLDARTTNGQVLLNGIEVSDRLDAHTRNGFTSVRVTGQAPKQTSVTAESGVYELKLPTADYWYPANSQQGFDDPRTPETITPEREQRSDSFDSSFGDNASPSPSVSPSASASGSPSGTPGAMPSTEGSNKAGAAPSNSARDESGIATVWTSEQACESAPGNRPCLFVAGQAASAQDSADMQYWRQEWNSAYDEAMRDRPWEYRDN